MHTVFGGIRARSIVGRARQGPGPHTACPGACRGKACRRTVVVVALALLATVGGVWLFLRLNEPVIPSDATMRQMFEQLLRLNDQVIPSDAAVRQMYEQHAEVLRKVYDTFLSEPRLRGLGRKELFGLLPGSSDERPMQGYRLEGATWVGGTSATRPVGLDLSAVLREMDLPAARYHEYLALLDKLGATSVAWVHRGRPDEELSILLVTRGIVPSGQSKSFVYFPNGIPPYYSIVETTDGIVAKGDWYSALGSGWYIHYQVW